MDTNQHTTLIDLRLSILVDQCRLNKAIPEVLFAKKEGEKGILVIGSPLTIELIIELRLLLDAKEREIKGIVDEET